MKSNETVVNEMEQEDRVYDYPDNCTQDEQYEKVEDNQLKIVSAEIEPSEEIEPEEEKTKFEKLEALIEKLPDRFPAASEIIKDETKYLESIMGIGEMVDHATNQVHSDNVQVVVNLINKNNTHGIVHAGFRSLRAFVARKKSQCKLTSLRRSFAKAQ